MPTKPTFFNTHIHIFKDVDIPEKFLPLKLVRVLASKTGFAILGRILNYINPLSNNDLFDRYVKFVRIGRLGSQKKIFEECSKFYPENTHFFVLTMDMAFMGAGKVPRNYTEQINELANITKEIPQIIPFLHIDPRREGIFELFKTCVTQHQFRGVKIYPPLGYFPYDERLYPVYKFCEDHDLPIIAHCSPYNPVRFKGSKNELYQLLSTSKTPIDVKGKSRKELCSLFTHPKNWEIVMNDFPKLRICLAHFGSEYYWNQFLDNPKAQGNWMVIIKEMMAKHKNLYSDISFTLNNKDFFPLLKVLLNDLKIRDQILFGSDYYMVKTKVEERRFGVDLRAFIGEDNFKTIAKTNPQAFLSQHVS
jgi:predicted TIM-barrel fold metal-dependent hydrolase